MRRHSGGHSLRALLAPLLSLGLVVAASPPATAATTPASTTDRIGLFSPDWKAIPSRSDAEWDAVAKRFSVVVGKITTHGPRLARMHAVNPALTVLVYDLGPYLSRGTPEYRATMAAHPDWFARDPAGQLINVNEFSHMTLMDQSVPGWRSMQAARVVAAVDRWGFDGVFMDGQGYAPTNGLYTTGVPVNRATGVAYTAAEWLQNSVLTINTVKAAVGDRYVLYNSLTDGVVYRDVSHVLATSNAEGGMVEGFLRGSRLPITAYPTVEDWRANLDMMLDMEAHGQHLFTWTKTWVPATSNQQERWNRFTLATYLLGRSDHAYYCFLPFEGADVATVHFANETTQLGAPTGPFSVNPDGTYVRRFTRGVVRVNPAAHTASIRLVA